MELWKRNLAVLWFGQFMVMAGMTMVIPFLPLFVQELGVKDPKEVSVWASLIFSANFVTSFFFQPFWGKLADRYGRKPMIIRSGLGMSLVVIGMGFSTTAWHLLVLRLLNGTISGFNPAATALVSANTPKEKMGFAMGVIQSGMVGGTIMGPVIGGLMADMMGFRPIFYVTGILLMIAALLAAFVVKEPFDRKKQKTRPAASMMQGLRKLWKIPQIPAIFTATFLIQFSLISSLPQIPLFIQRLHGDEMVAFLSGLVGSVTGLSNMVLSPVLGRLSDRVGGAAGILFWCLLGMAVIYFPQGYTTHVWQLLALRFVQGAFMGGLLPSINSLISQYTPKGMESRAYGFNSSFMALGNLAGPVAGGFIVPWFGIEGIFIFGAILLLANGIWVRNTLYVPKKSSLEAGDG